MKRLLKFASKITALISSFVLACTITMTTVVDAADTAETSRLLQCDHIEELSDGGKIYVYYIDGVENDFPVPPEGFNPVKASDEALATYGFPPRPTEATELAEWEKNMSLYKGTNEPQIAQTNIVFGENKENCMKYESSPILTDSYFTQYSSLWSGYYSDVSGLNNKYTQVQTDYNHPTITGISGNSYNNVAGYWCGLGGKNSFKLVQAGTADTGMQKHWAWYEYLSSIHYNPAVEITSLTINPGDSIHIYVAFSAALNHFNYYIANNTTGYSASSVITIDANEYYDGTTAEWITEKASSSLPNFGSITMTNCKAILYTSSNWTNLNSMYGVEKIILTSNGTSTGTALCTPGSIYNYHSFTSTWNGYN
jgi:hypothetical protein